MKPSFYAGSRGVDRDINPPPAIYHLADWLPDSLENAALNGGAEITMNAYT